MVWSLRLLFVHCTTPLRACKELQWLHETTRIDNLQNAWIIRWQKVDVPGSFLERSTFRFVVVSDHSLNLHLLGRLWVPFYCTRCPKLSVCHFRCTKPDKSSWLIICVSISVVNVLGVYWVVHLAYLRSRSLEVMGARKNGAREGDMRGERKLPLSSSVSLARPVYRLQPRLLFFNPFNFFNVFPFICDQVYFFQILNYKVPSCHSFPRIHFLTPGRLFPSGGESAASKF